MLFFPFIIVLVRDLRELLWIKCRLTVLFGESFVIMVVHVWDLGFKPFILRRLWQDPFDVADNSVGGDMYNFLMSSNPSLCEQVLWQAVRCVLDEKV